MGISQSKSILSRVGDINVIKQVGANAHATVTYYPFHFACPLISFSIMQWRNGIIELFISLARLPKLEGLMQRLEEKGNGKYTPYNFYQSNVQQQDIDWFVNLLKDINLEFNQHFFDNDIIKEVSQVFTWLTNPSLNKKPYEHLASEATSPARSYLNPALEHSKALFDAVNNYIDATKDCFTKPIACLPIERQKLAAKQKHTQAKVIACLAAGENPNQLGRKSDCNPLDTIMRYLKSITPNLSHTEMQRLEIYLTEIALAFINYGLNPLCRNNIFGISTLEVAATSMFWPVYNLIIRSINKSRPALQIKQPSVDYIKNDRIYTELLFEDKDSETGVIHIRTCVMPTSYLRQDEVIELYAVFVKLFAGANDDNKEKICNTFLNDLLKDGKMIEIFYHNQKIIGFNLTSFDMDELEKEVVFRGDYFLVEKAYQQRYGLIGYAYPRLALALKFYFGNSKKWREFSVAFHCETGTPDSYNLFKHLLHFPKFQTEKIARKVRNLTCRIFGDMCLYVHQGIKCFFRDYVTVTAMPKRNFNVFEEFFMYFLRGLTQAEIDRLTSLNFATPIFLYIEEKYFENWVAHARKIGVMDAELRLLKYTILLTKATWFYSMWHRHSSSRKEATNCALVPIAPESPVHGFSYFGVFASDEHKFFLGEHRPVAVTNKSIMPGCASL